MEDKNEKTELNSSQQGKINENKKRRPGRDPEMKSIPVVDVESEVVLSAEEESHIESQEPKSEDLKNQDFSTQTEPNEASFLNFKGADVIKEKFPKGFQVAEKIASDWMNDGKFEDLDLGHPLAQHFAGKGLRKAKEFEKKIMESPVTEKIAMQALTAGMKAQELIAKMKDKVKK